MKAFLKFLNKHSVLVCLAIIVSMAVFFPLDALAATSTGNTGDALSKGTGPFEAFLTRGASLFAYTRNALFVVAAFAFIVYAWKAIQGDGVDWKGLLFLIVALVLLGVAGFIVGYLADPTKNTTLQSSYESLQDTQWK